MYVHIPGKEGDWIWQHSQEGKVNVAKDLQIKSSHLKQVTKDLFASFTTSIIGNEWGLSESNRRQREKRKVY